MLRPCNFASFAFSAAKFPSACPAVGRCLWIYSKIMLVNVTAERVSGVKA
jgi:hypothetical protein